MFVYCSVLESLTLPACIEEAGAEAEAGGGAGGAGGGAGVELTSRAEAVRASGGIHKLQELLTELPELLQRNSDILDEVTTTYMHTYILILLITK